MPLKFIRNALSTTWGTYRPILRKWPRVAKRANIWLMVVEFFGLVAVLVVFAMAQPDLYRTAMWKIGWDNGLNSDPNVILYAYANHRPLPTLPLIWSQTLTDFNVAISVISLFFLLTKLIGIIMKLWVPIFATFINVSMVALYTVSVYGQIGPDYSDPRYPAPAAWYFRFGCDLAKPSGNYSNCQLAQGSLFATLYMLVVYLLNLGFAGYAMWPNKINDVVSDDEDDDAESNLSEPKDMDMEMEMQSMKPAMTASGAMPYTPRTQAFYTLDRQLPLRQPQPVRYVE